MEESSSSSRRVVVLRHGERMDLTFGNAWIKEDYVRTDLNMPESIPTRVIWHWEKDSPLTTLGEFQSTLIGMSLKASGIAFSHVLVSPAYRCLQTATKILTAMGAENELKLNIEYGLFEWLGFYKDNLPQWLSEQEAGKLFNINQDYQPVFTRDEYLSQNAESLDEIYDFNSRATKEFLEKHDGNVLIVAHGTNLETCTRELLGKQKRPWSHLRPLFTQVPYVGAIAMEQKCDKTYKLIDPPCLKLTHEASKRFFWRSFDDDYSKDSDKDGETINQVAAGYAMKIDAHAGS